MKLLKTFLPYQQSAKWAVVLMVTLQIGNSALAAIDQSGADDSLSLNPISETAKQPAAPASGSVLALNRDLTINGKLIPKASELIVDESGNALLVHTSENGEDTGEVADIGLKVKDLVPNDYTVLKQNEETGEIDAFNIPDDMDLAGRGRGRSKRSGVTNCFHVVKALVRGRISLTGVAAYMAAPQLRAAGWHRYANYAAAPMRSICVFAAGGIKTSSGGQIYGHIGVKGAGGIANPMSGFHLKRPFLGCWDER